MTIIRPKEFNHEKRRVGERAILFRMLTDINLRMVYIGVMTDIEDGVYVRVVNGSGRAVVDADILFPTAEDSEFVAAGKKRFLREVKQKLEKLAADTPKGAA